MDSFFCRRACGGGVGEHHPAGLVGQLEAFEGVLEVSDVGVVDAFGAAAVEADVVGCPSSPEGVAASDEFTYEVGEAIACGSCPAAVRREATMLFAPCSQSG